LATARFLILKSNLNIQLTTSSLRGRIGSHYSSTHDKVKVVK
jgi:hypothetical protein